MCLVLNYMKSAGFSKKIREGKYGSGRMRRAGRRERAERGLEDFGRAEGRRGEVVINRYEERREGESPMGWLEKG